MSVGRQMSLRKVDGAWKIARRKIILDRTCSWPKRQQSSSKTWLHSAFAS